MRTDVAIYEPMLYGFPQTYWLRFWLVPMISSECKKYVFRLGNPPVTDKRTIEIIVIT